MQPATKKQRPNRVHDLVGRRYGRLVVVREAARRVTPGGVSRIFWLCRCDCGVEKEVPASSLRSGYSTSCGCLHREQLGQRQRTHGMSTSREFCVWAHMVERCTNDKAKDFKYYGARGIAVCQRWASSFEAFYADMGPRPVGMSIDRVDVNGHYEPGNCRWATHSQQMRNTRRSNPSAEKAA